LGIGRNLECHPGNIFVKVMCNGMLMPSLDNETMTERDMSDLERFIVREKDCTRCDTQIRAILVGIFVFADV
jgi:hypothetical protein